MADKTGVQPLVRISLVWGLTLALLAQMGIMRKYPRRMMTMMTLLLSLRRLATTASRDKVTRSPRAAAMGVATLSGLTLYLLDTAITATITIPARNEDDKMTK